LFLNLDGYNNRTNAIDFELLSPKIKTILLTVTAITGDLIGMQYSLIDEFDYSEIYSLNVGKFYWNSKTVIVGKLIRESEGFRFEAYTEAYDDVFIDVFKRFAPDRRICRT
jgi:stress response protein SCP2